MPVSPNRPHLDSAALSKWTLAAVFVFVILIVAGALPGAQR